MGVEKSVSAGVCVYVHVCVCVCYRVCVCVHVCGGVETDEHQCG